MVNVEIRLALMSIYRTAVAHDTTKKFHELIKTYGPTVKRISRSKMHSYWLYTILPLCDIVRSSEKITGFLLNSEKLALFSERRATHFTDEILGRIGQKAGILKDAKVLHAGGLMFLIQGTKSGHAVKIEQTHVRNTSVNGNLFDQYPARIYVNEKFMSAANFAKL